MDLVLSFIWQGSNIKDRIENKLAFSSLRFVLKLVNILSWKYSILRGHIILRSILGVNNGKSLTILVSLGALGSIWSPRLNMVGQYVCGWCTPEYLVCCWTEVRNTPLVMCLDWWPNNFFIQKIWIKWVIQSILWSWGPEPTLYKIYGRRVEFFHLWGISRDCCIWKCTNVHVFDKLN